MVDEAAKQDRKTQFRLKWREKKRKLEETLGNDADEHGKIHVPKTKYVIAFGYVGTRFHGYQKQVEYDTDNMDKVVTVEGTIESALNEVGAVHEIYRDMPNKLQMSKASRTDKGVHAGCTYIGGRFKFPNPDGAVSELNSALPTDVRCFQILRVTKGFDARSMCSKRKYEYIFPEWFLMRCVSGIDGKVLSRLTDQFDALLTSNGVIRYTRSSDLKGEGVNRVYVESPLDIERFSEILNDFRGTHDFHNFTSKQKAQGSTVRFVHQTKAKLVTINNTNAIKVIITGQSFLYNQIRKMIALALEVYLNTAPKNAIKFTLHKNHYINTNIAPSNGLILHHTPMILYKDIKSSVEEFKRSSIYPAVLESFNTDVWRSWMDNILQYPFYQECSSAVGDSITK